MYIGWLLSQVVYSYYSEYDIIFVKSFNVFCIKSCHEKNTFKYQYLKEKSYRFFEKSLIFAVKVIVDRAALSSLYFSLVKLDAKAHYTDNLFSPIPDCDTGYFGAQCAKPCSEHCAGIDNTCNNVNGTCNMGCDPGYNGSLCTQGKCRRLYFTSVFLCWCF